MDRLQEKTTAPYPPVGADGGQSLSQKPNQSIAEGVTEHKPPERDLEEILRQISRVNDPAYLPTVSMNDLYEQVYPGRPPVVDGLLYAGTYLFVGAPKVGKSFLMAQLAYHVSMGLSLWGYEVRQGTVLYLALEDNHRRLQERLYRMFGVESTGNLFFAIGAKQLGGGLEEQLKGFVREHTDTRLIIIDTLQKIIHHLCNGIHIVLQIGINRYGSVIITARHQLQSRPESLLMTDVVCQLQTGHVSVRFGQLLYQ